MVDRWVLSRAGITNVYQYGEEVLDFAGGRLLLRGVNGSGKSTAMNMLLPFLLEADTRRIDAAGEQSGVLRSWMLNGRDEQQPQGYLWIELARGDEHLTVGCGIRANRSTDRVTTWWFVTARRPGIDLALVEGRQPLSVDALRAVLEPGAVHRHDQRAAYRAEVRARLYGGADLDQHLRLLHVVRSPRVGDRIDLDLPRYLEDALPQLSDAALDDAAQPLEDLEEHRRNVEDLTRTATALTAIEAGYRAYARTELHRRTDRAVELLAERDRLVRAESGARDALHEAVAARGEARTRSQGLEVDERRLDGEIRDLEASDAYQAGAELNDLRHHVRSLDAQVAQAAGDQGRRIRRVESALAAVLGARQAAEADAEVAQRELGAVAALAGQVGLDARPPDVPGIEVARLDGGLDDDGPEVPVAPIAADALRAPLGDVRAAAHRRRGDVAEVTDALGVVDRAEADLGRAEERASEAAQGVDRAETAFGGARVALGEEAEAWRSASSTWTGRLAAHREAHGLAAASTVDPAHLADPARHHEVLAAGWLALARETVEHHARVRAVLSTRHGVESSEVERSRVERDELDARTLPEPPATAWQRSERVATLADLVDFADDVADADRAGLEAALVAAGLLGAELGSDGALVLTDGDLLVGPGPPAGRSLATLLTVTVADHLDATVDTDALRGVLAAISIDPDDLDGTEDRTVVTVDGRFRTGALRGRHRVEVAEHIGLTARRAALDRRRAAAAEALRVAEEVLDATTRELAATEEHLEEAAALARALPSTAAVVRASSLAQVAEEALGEARGRLAERRTALLDAERFAAEASDECRRVAASLGLPHERAALDEVGTLAAGAASACDLADRAVGALARAVAGWRERGEGWAEAVADARAGRRSLDELRSELDRLASRLATLEDSIGLDHDRVVAAIATSRADLDRARRDLGEARRQAEEAAAEVARADEQQRSALAARVDADGRATAVLPGLRAVLEVPGLLTAALGPDTDTGTTPVTDAEAGDTDPVAPEAGRPEPALPAVAESPDGVRRLARALRALVSAPEGPPTGAESVRQSLRQRRPDLGAGWDAEDRQPDEDLPLHIEVTGRLGDRMALPDAAEAIRVDLRRTSGLLSAKQDQALRNLLQGLVAKEVAEKLHAARELVARMNRRLDTITTSQGIGVTLRWRRRDDLDDDLADTVDLLAKPPDLRTVEEDARLIEALSRRIADARRDDPELPYRDLVAGVLDYRAWHRMALVLRRPGRSDERLTRRTALSEGEKKMVSYLPLFAAVAASCDALAEAAPDAPRFVLLDDAFAKVSEDNHAKLFGLLVELDLDFIATSERLWGTHATVPELAITEVIRDADLGAIVLEHSRWDGHRRESV